MFVICTGKINQRTIFTIQSVILKDYVLYAVVEASLLRLISSYLTAFMPNTAPRIVFLRIFSL
jgi:hypothetical protein